MFGASKKLKETEIAAQKAAVRETQKKTLADFEAKFKAAKQLPDMGERFLAFKELAETTAAAKNTLEEFICKYEAKTPKKAWVAIGAGMGGTIASTVGLCIVSSGIGTLFMIPAILSIVGGANLGIGWDIETTAQEREKLRQENAEFLQGVQDIIEKSNAAAKDISENYLADLARSAVLEKVMEDSPALKSVFSDMAMKRFVAAQAAPAKPATARERFGLGE